MIWPDAPTEPVARWGISVLVILAGYLIGCFATGYYLVRFRTGTDVRGKGSGSAGATNAGRALGSAGFTITFILDLAKGALVAWLAIYLGLGPWARLLCVLAVIVGHIWPIQLRFRGGKGAATLLGVILVVDYRMALAIMGLFVVAFILLRRFTLAGLAALAAAPPVIAVGFPAPGRALGLLALTLPVLFAHRQNIREETGMRFAWAGGKSPSNPPRHEDEI